MHNKHTHTLELSDFSPSALQRIQSARILCIGAGGLGSAVLPILAAQDIDTLHIVEPDVIAPSNLPRQLLYTSEEIGKEKASIAAHSLQQLAPSTRILTYKTHCDAPWLENFKTPIDIILDCTDNFATRTILNHFAAEKHIPLVFGAVEAYTGQLTLLHAKNEIDLYDIFDSLPSTAISKAIFPPLVQQMGSMMAGVALRWLAFGEHELDGKFLQLDARTFQTLIFEIQPRH